MSRAIASKPTPAGAYSSLVLLALHGEKDGRVEDESGHASSIIHARLDLPNTSTAKQQLSRTLRSMERAGLIQREMNEKRCYAIWLTAPLNKNQVSNLENARSSLIATITGKKNHPGDFTTDRPNIQEAGRKGGHTARLAVAPDMLATQPALSPVTQIVRVVEQLEEDNNRLKAEVQTLQARIAELEANTDPVALAKINEIVSRHPNLS